jgi:hypothetical protein
VLGTHGLWNVLSAAGIRPNVHLSFSPDESKKHLEDQKTLSCAELVDLLSSEARQKWESVRISNDHTMVFSGSMKEALLLMISRLLLSVLNDIMDAPIFAF